MRIPSLEAGTIYTIFASFASKMYEIPGSFKPSRVEKRVFMAASFFKDFDVEDYLDLRLGGLIF